jgi:hypothetical protein
MELLTSAIEPHFRRAGWLPTRRVAVDCDVPADHPAYTVLQSFGGLRVGEVGTGEDCARSDVEFCAVEEDDALVQAWQSALGTRFLSIGECHNGHGQLWLDGRGRLFHSGIVAPMVLYEGPTFASGMERLLRGRRSQPMLLPWQDEVMIWGHTFHAGDDEVLSVESFHVR